MGWQQALVMAHTLQTAGLGPCGTQGTRQAQHMQQARQTRHHGHMPAATASARFSGRLLAAWGVFCLLMMLVGLQERWYAGEPLWPWPVFYEAAALLVASGVAAWRWRRGPLDDAWLATPRQWFWRVLRWTPLMALAFVAGLYGLRHGVRAAFGLSYEHQAWPAVLAYEGLKFAVFYLLFAGLQFGLRSFEALAAQKLHAERLERLSSQARLAQLTQQMQPHLLFNALNTIASLVYEDPAAADAAIVRLAALLRAATEAARRPLHPLADELALAHGHAALMQQRFGPERVRVDWQAEAVDAQVPVLSLQPLLENAFVHAVEPRAGLTTITVTVQRHGKRLRLAVADDGSGPPADRNAKAHTGVALDNLRERLQALYGVNATLLLSPRAEGPGLVALMELPLDD